MELLRAANPGVDVRLELSNRGDDFAHTTLTFWLQR
jgi:hypothetical protein